MVKKSAFKLQQIRLDFRFSMKCFGKHLGRPIQLVSESVMQQFNKKCIIYKAE